MKGATLLLALSYAWLALGQPIFLYPSHNSHGSYVELDAKQANIVLSHHLRLDSQGESYKTVMSQNNPEFERYLQRVAHNDKNFVGSGLESAMVVSVETRSDGECRLQSSWAVTLAQGQNC